MARERKTKYPEPVGQEALTALERELIDNSPAFIMVGSDAAAFVTAFAPPGSDYPVLHKPKPDDPNPNAYRDWLIRVLSFLIECYPHPVNLALDSLKISLTEVNRGLTPNLFKPHKPAKGGKGNFGAQEAMNLAILAADYIHDNIGNDDAYAQVLADANTTGREIEGWRMRIDPAFRCTSITAWAHLDGAQRVLATAVADVRLAIGRKPRAKRVGTSGKS